MKTILFVCTANIARSPMAEALFNQKMEAVGFSDQYKARSAGTWGQDGLPAAGKGQQVMKTMGIDLSTHRSSIVTPELIYAVDSIFTMEAGHKEALQVEFPFKRDRIWLLTEAVGPGYDILDPLGGLGKNSRKRPGNWKPLSIEW